METGTRDSQLGVAGDVTPEKAAVWLRAEPNSQVFYTTARNRPSGFSAIGPVLLDGNADYTAVIELEKLEPATTYYYRCCRCREAPGYIAHFVTAPGTG
jgi:phosphodiesterase/alkaline phosphatase D-like protein